MNDSAVAAVANQAPAAANQEMKSITLVDSVPDHWPIKKALTHCDVDITHPFLTLGRQQVETHIVLYMTPTMQNCLRDQGQVNLNALDNDTEDMHVMKLKWSGSYYTLIGKWGKIVRDKRLNVGQEIKLRYSNNCLFFSVSGQQQQLIDPVPPLVDHWPIRKVLTLSDVDPTHPFLLLPCKGIDDHILSQWAPDDRESMKKEQQMSVNVRDYKTGDVYSMKLRWRGDYYNLVGKWGNVIRHKGLVVGQEIRLQWMSGYLYFSVSEGLYRDIESPWPIRKVLTLSDVDIHHPFLTLPGKAVDDHVLFHWEQSAREQLMSKRQVGINGRDEDTGEVYVMKLKCCGSYYNLIGKWGKIIREKMLNVGTEIRLRWDNECLMFSVAQ